MKVEMVNMKGEVPAIKPHLLPPEWASYAENCHVEEGVLTPIHNSKHIGMLTEPPVSFYLYQGQHWFVWRTHVDAIASPMAQDAWQRVYYTGDGPPRVTAHDVALGAKQPNVSYVLGVPKPHHAPRVSSSFGFTDQTTKESDNDEHYVYVYTYVTRFGEEGPPSDPSSPQRHPASNSMLVVRPGNLPNNPHNITHVRVYRSDTSNEIAHYRLIQQIPLGGTYYDHFKDRLTEVLSTWEVAEPDPNMVGLCAMANGICVGFYQNELMFSEAYLPYSWPKRYRVTIESDIVGLAPMGTSLVVLTTGHPYWFSGITPAAMTGSKMMLEQACVSRASIAIVNGQIIYASADGLVGVSRDSARLLTQALITRKQWQEYTPSSIKAWSYNGLYLVQYKNGGFIFDPTMQDFRRISGRWQCGFKDLVHDTLYVANGRYLYQWDQGSFPLEIRWHSKVFRLPHGTALSCCKVVTPQPALMGLRVSVDGRTVIICDVGQLPPSGLVRLPAQRGRDWQVEVWGKTTIEHIVMATSLSEIEA